MKGVSRGFLYRHAPDFIVLVLGMAALLYSLGQLELPRKLNRVVLAVALSLMFAGLALRSLAIAMMFPLRLVELVRMCSYLALFISGCTAAAVFVRKLLPAARPEHSPGRRRFLGAARAAVLASPAIATGYGVFIQRDDFRVREVDVPMRALAKELDGLRIVQLSDLHVSPFLSVRELERVIDMANGTRAHIALVTGDLTTSYQDPLDACLDRLARLNSEAGVFGCLGNHEVYNRAEDYAEREGARRGIRILRDRSAVLEFRGKPLNLAGVDYQPMRVPYLKGAGRHVKSGMPNILLSHNPDVFPTAAAKGFDLTIGGHTHGGQINFELLSQNLSVARFYTPYVYGLYRLGPASAYVSRGIGTVAVPARLGAPPEVALIRLCAT
jgi:uncharacterized protein